MAGKEPSLFIRMARPDDAEECHRIDVEAWGEESAATAEMMRQRIATYRSGNFVAIERDTGVIVGSVWTMAACVKKWSGKMIPISTPSSVRSCRIWAAEVTVRRRSPIGVIEGGNEPRLGAKPGMSR